MVRQWTYLRASVEGTSVDLPQSECRGYVNGPTSERVTRVRQWTYLRASDDDTDEVVVIGAQSTHTVVQAAGEIARLALHTLH